MLVLTRRTGESMKIGSDIIITVMVIYEKKIMVRVQAPKNTKLNLRLGKATPITDDITITLAYIDKCQVTLGIEAPAEMRIERGNNHISA
ncbi:MAG: carbon storage regulator [Candidatus Brocadiaceae bacterium]|nr:carbon storage regulator [Candidatus Brocadiaceae bacterium]